MGWGEAARNRRDAAARRRRGSAVVVVCALAAISARAQEPPAVEPPATVPPATVLAPAPPAADTGEPPTPEARLRRGTNLFEYGDCANAVAMLSPLASPGQLPDEREQVEVHRMLGVCFYQLGRIADASRELNSLLYIDPDYTLDPFLTPPPVVELFEAQKAGIRQKLDEIKEARKQNGRPAKLPGVLVERTTVVRESPFATVFMPFGLAQMTNGELVKGIVVGSIQGGLLAANVTLYWSSLAISRPATSSTTECPLGPGACRVVDDPATQTVYTALQYAGGAALVLAIGAYLYGVGDAWWFREDREVVERRESRRTLSADEVARMRKLDPGVE